MGQVRQWRSTSEGKVPVCDRTKYVCLKNMFVRKREKYTWGGGGGGGEYVCGKGTGKRSGEEEGWGMGRGGGVSLFVEVREEKLHL